MNKTVLNKRIAEIDIVRGLVMLLMALDHVRDLMHVSSLTQSPTDLNTTTPALFFSRWITYLCAPTFVFLSGVSVWIAARRSNETGMSPRFLLKRGLWLIALEFTLVNFALWFDFQFRILMLQVIASIGIGFILLSALLKTSPRVIAIASVVILSTHDLLSLVPQSKVTFLNILRNLLFTPGVQQVSPDFMFFVAYPIVPWIAIMLLGYAAGGVFEQSEVRRNGILLKVSLGLLVVFTVVRLLNSYGDPLPWKPERNVMLTILSFVNVTKYPPSLLYACLFLGLMGMLLRFSYRLPEIIRNVLSVYGRVPLFYYLLHLYLIRLCVFVMVFAQGYHGKDLLFGPFQFGRPATGSGIDLAGVLIVWLIIVAALYPLCKWYGAYKRRNADVWWLKYL